MSPEEVAHEMARRLDSRSWDSSDWLFLVLEIKKCCEEKESWYETP